MRKVLLLLLCIGLILSAAQPAKADRPPASGATEQKTQDKTRYALIPQPNHLEERAGEFVFNDSTRILLSDPTNERLRTSANLFADILRTGAALPMRVSRQMARNDQHQNAIILLLTDKMESQGDLKGDYTLEISSDNIVVRAPDSKGLFYGLQTIRQLLPPDVERGLGLDDQQWSVPAVYIKDSPRFQHRGMHLDVGRHFFEPWFIKKYIDLLALYKMDTFHWHLTEDQGWRIEIKQYPRLTEFGACRDSSQVGSFAEDTFDGARYCGYYTQEEIREIVDYAQKRHITIIPEIEMPGHSSAAVASYPQFGCTGKQIDVKTDWGIYEDIYCPKEKTFEFLQNVLLEVMDLFPSEYIHIGGDEAPKDQWEESEVAQKVIEREGLADEAELQSYFVSRIEQFLNRHGRQLIGWEDILEGGLPPRATVMAWRSMEPAVTAAREGHNVIIAVNDALYFNFCHDEPEVEPVCHRKPFHATLKNVYDFGLIPDELSEDETGHILGAQGQVWTEYIKTPNKVEYMAFPHVLGLAEKVWTETEGHDWESLQQRLPRELDRLEALDVDYRPPNWLSE